MQTSAEDRVNAAIDETRGLFCLADLYNLTGGQVSRQLILYHLARRKDVVRLDYGLYRRTQC